MNACKGSGKTPAGADLAVVAGWLDEHVTWQQGVLFAA